VQSWSGLALNPDETLFRRTACLVRQYLQRDKVLEVKEGVHVIDHEFLTYRNAGNRSLLDLLPSTPGRVLDCGCGAGDNARILNSRGWRDTAVTLDRREGEAASQHCEAVHVADLEDGLPCELVGTYDVVLASHVLEHLANPERLLHQVRERLNTGGVLAVALPNIAHYSQRISFLRGNFAYTETGILDRTHLRFYTFWTAIELLQRNGFTLIVADTEGTLPWWKSRDLLPAWLVCSIDRMVVAHLPNLFGHQSLLIARPERTSA
jgi:2-polyprenyl-3-methyl-5-hydroxy-6-metoxy-1,4-benzoquinol methylase